MNYYIQGSPARAEEIKAAFEKLGFICTLPNCLFDNENLIFLTSSGVVYSFYAYQQIYDIIKTHPDYKELELAVKPKFKVGDSLQSGSHFTKILSINLEEGRYYCDNRIISFENQDLWHLVPKPHYDIANFKPFDKVLIRVGNKSKWTCDFFSYYHKGFHCIGTDDWNQCIPFEGNEHLLGTTDMPDEMYINW